MAILLPVRAAFRTIVALRIALSVRRDLLIECLALRHQLAVLGRSDRRFRPSDRLFWVCLRRWWPGWKNALVLVQPATVARWHREGLRRCWSRRSRRRPGRPCIDADLRALTRRMATENPLWGAPRIHGELLKLGMVVSERTASRYLPDRGTAPSQTWRTFLANHLVALASTSSVTSNPPGDAIDEFDTRRCLAPSMRDGSAECAGPQRRAETKRRRRRSSRGVPTRRFRDAAHRGGTEVGWPHDRRDLCKSVPVPPNQTIACSRLWRERRAECRVQRR
jgi:hypothetical protein